MIKRQGSFEIHNNEAFPRTLRVQVENLPEGEYKYLILDDKKNPVLPQLKYLFGVVLKTISDELPSHPPVNALYRYFEEVYAPLRICEIEGERYEYFDLKNEKSVEVNNVINDIVHHATSQWRITIPERDSLKSAEATELYADAYLEAWKNTLNSNIIHAHE